MFSKVYLNRAGGLGPRWSKLQVMGYQFNASHAAAVLFQTQPGRDAYGNSNGPTVLLNRRQVRSLVKTLRSWLRDTAGSNNGESANGRPVGFEPTYLGSSPSSPILP